MTVRRESLMALAMLAWLPAAAAQEPTHAAPQVQRVLGLPLDGDWVVFVIDTSGSMLATHWKEAQDVVGAILSAHPTLRGLQIMDDEGKSLWPRTSGQWLVDSPEQRRRLLQRMPRWRAYSDSDPVQGIVKALELGTELQGNLDVYVLSDEFTGSSVAVALEQVALASSKGAQEARNLRIHGIVFPPAPQMPPHTYNRLVELMEPLCRENGGMLVSYAAPAVSGQGQ